MCTVCTVSSVQSAVVPRLGRAGAGRAVGHFPQSAVVSVQSAQLFALLREQCHSVTELSTSPFCVTLSIVQLCENILVISNVTI